MSKSQLTFSALHWMGFDMDHTLVRYNQPAVFSLIFSAIRRYLVEIKGYPAQLATVDAAEGSKMFHKGLVFDSKLGNILRLTSSGKILQATHGTLPLSSESTSQAYLTSEDELAEAVQRLSKGERAGHRFHSFMTYFDLPGLCVAASAVDALDSVQGAGHANYASVLPDIFDALNFNFNHEHFSKDDGFYFKAVKDDPEKYLYRCSSEVKKWIASLRKSGVKIFILTNSHGDYASHLMEFAYGPDWESHFDLVIFKGQKPAFFKFSEEDQAFMTLVNGNQAGVPSELALGTSHVHGNKQGLEKLFRDHTPEHVEDLAVAYFGDHVMGDVMAVTNHTNWKSVAIVEEVLVDQVPESSPHEVPCPVFTADTDTHDFLSQSVREWGHIYFDKEYLIHDLLRDHSDLIVPHLDSLAVFPLNHTFGHDLTEWHGHDYSSHCDLPGSTHDS